MNYSVNGSTEILGEPLNPWHLLALFLSLQEVFYGFNVF